MAATTTSTQTTTTTTSTSPLLPKIAEQNQQQEQQQPRQYKIRMHLHSVQLHRFGGIAIIVAVFGLLLTTICVSGQIDGYEAGVDYPAYEVIPKGLSFNCQGRLPGYYADTETRCQVWHWCLHSGHQYSFLCPNGTVFNQAVRVCDWWTNVNCPIAEELYRNNEELYKTTERNQLTDV